jgi:hypothetical protein
MNRLLLSSAAICLLSAMSPAHADTLLIQHAQMAQSIPHPARGMSMAAVEKKFGAPTQKLEPRGGQKPQWPVINRWQYAQYTVYFDRGRVVDVVLNQATPEEIGPAPAH